MRGCVRRSVCPSVCPLVGNQVYFISEFHSKSWCNLYPKASRGPSINYTVKIFLHWIDWPTSRHLRYRRAEKYNGFLSILLQIVPAKCLFFTKEIEKLPWSPQRPPLSLPHFPFYFPSFLSTEIPLRSLAHSTASEKGKKEIREEKLSQNQNGFFLRFKINKTN